MLIFCFAWTNAPTFLLTFAHTASTWAVAAAVAAVVAACAVAVAAVVSAAAGVAAGPSHRLWRWGGHGGVSGGRPPRKKIHKLKPIASISGHLVPFQCNYNERLFDSATNQEDTTIGDKHYPPLGKNSKQ